MLTSMKPVVIGLQGQRLTVQERTMLNAEPPMGIILFRRNIDTPEQVRYLIAEARDSSGWHLPVWIDQEGGRVQRLGAPYWRRYSPAAIFGDAYRRNPQHALSLLHTHAAMICYDLHDLGIDVDCLPLLDIRQSDTDWAIGDRAFADDIAIVSACGQVVRDTLMAHGIVPIMKHLPGHGRATVDSHLHLPVVSATEQELIQHDLAPFAALSDTPMAMTAHIVYTVWDDRPATLSPWVLSMLRQRLSYNGLLVSDDLNMKALAAFGDIPALCQQTLAAGVDIALYCAGDTRQNQAVLAACDTVSDRVREGWRHCESIRQTQPPPLDQQAVRAYLDWCT